MAGTRFQVSIYGDRLMQRKLLRLVSNAEDLRPAWPAVARRAGQEFDRQFAQQGSPKWQALKPGTIRQRIAEGFPPGPILNKTGALRAAWADPDTDESADELDLTVDIEYAKTHQFGRGAIPARPVRLPRAAQRDIVFLIRDHIVGPLDRMRAW